MTWKRKAPGLAAVLVAVSLGLAAHDELRSSRPPADSH